MADNEGRCISCGFLAKRPMRSEYQGYSRIFEVDQAERAEPLLAFRASLEPGGSSGFPWDLFCLRQAADLSREIGPIGGDQLGTAGRAEAAKRVINKDRHCDKWFSYTVGLEPKDHYMELRTIQLERDRQEFQLRIVELERGIRQHQEESRAEQDAR